MEKTYKITGKTNPWIAQRDSLFRGKTEITLVSDLSLKSARNLLRNFFCNDYDCHFSTWANVMSSNVGKHYATRHDDGTYSYEYDSRYFAIELETPDEIFRKMDTMDCINYWNESAVDHYCKAWEIHEMGDEDWWNYLSNELGAWDLIQAVLSAGEHFNDSDKYFFYDEDCNHMRSFSTKQELIEQIGDDFFIENLTNEE